jgi:hypothetical protein
MNNDSVVLPATGSIPRDNDTSYHNTQSKAVRQAQQPNNGAAPNKQTNSKNSSSTGKQHQQIQSYSSAQATLVNSVQNMQDLQLNPGSGLQTIVSSEKTNQQEQKGPSSFVYIQSGQDFPQQN